MASARRSRGDEHAAGAVARAGLGRRYRTEVLLGRGGMAEVWLAYDRVLARKCVLKVPLSDGGHARLLREAQVGALLRGNGTATVHDYRFVGDRRLPIIVFEHLEGPTLAEHLDDKGALAPREAVAILRAAAVALVPAHAAGVVHRDIKPANLILCPSGEVKIIDFGVAHLAGAEPLTESGDHLGTARYMPVEQAMAPQAVDARADIHALGVVLYQMLAGTDALPPFDAFAAIRCEPPAWPRLPDVRERAPDAPAALARLIEKATAPDPADRYADILSLVTDLDNCLGEEHANTDHAPATSISPPEPSPPESTTPPPVVAQGPRVVAQGPRAAVGRIGISRSAAAAMLILMITAIGAGAVSWLARERSPQRPAQHPAAAKTVAPARAEPPPIVPAPPPPGERLALPHAL